MIRIWAGLLLWISAGICAAEWKPLWDGQTLAGWQVIGAGQWTVENGAIHGRHSRWSWTYGHLVSQRAFTNFTVRFKFKALAGNSGFYFRSARSGSSGMEGFQAEIDPEEHSGGIYESGGRGWVVKPAADQLRQHFRQKDWNDMTVKACGRRLQVYLNDWKAAEVEDATGRMQGNFAFQLHARQNVEIWFKDLEIQEE